MSVAATQRGRRGSAPGRRIALFGGTFDPIHAGHLAVARAAVRRFGLDQVHFIPSAYPPHKPCSELSPFAHRFAMVALACAEDPRFLPSLAEADPRGIGGRAFYSVDTVRRFRRQFHADGNRIFFLLGADSFLQIASWKHYRVLLGLCDFVAAHRPGFRTDALRRAVPPDLLGKPEAPAARSRVHGTIPLRRTMVYLLDAVHSHVSATAVRRRAGNGQSIRGLVPPRVEEYIKKEALYR